MHSSFKPSKWVGSGGGGGGAGNVIPSFTSTTSHTPPSVLLTSSLLRTSSLSSLDDVPSSDCDLNSSVGGVGAMTLMLSVVGNGDIACIRGAVGGGGRDVLGERGLLVVMGFNGDDCVP